ncbi:MAG: TetR family transcriptional regulator [Acidobacteria bacterium]|nr:MAG: TetR family transcriptional regulator [Acidobacteriota bacterium]
MKKNRAGQSRLPVTRERILRAAIAVADEHGLAAVTMRRLGSELGVEAMSLYKHVANKDAILDGIAELVIGEIEVPGGEAGWMEAMRRRARSAREVLTRHSWAVGLMESRATMAVAVEGYVDSVLGILRSGGFSIEDAAHAFWLLDNYVYGHVIHEASVARGNTERATGPASTAGGEVASGDHSHLREVKEYAQDFEFSMDGEFEFGLDLILNALNQRLQLPSELGAATDNRGTAHRK